MVDPDPLCQLRGWAVATWCCRPPMMPGTGWREASAERCWCCCCRPGRVPPIMRRPGSSWACCSCCLVGRPALQVLQVRFRCSCRPRSYPIAAGDVLSFFLVQLCFSCPLMNFSVFPVKFKYFVRCHGLMYCRFCSAVAGLGGFLLRLFNNSFKIMGGLWEAPVGLVPSGGGF